MKTRMIAVLGAAVLCGGLAAAAPPRHSTTRNPEPVKELLGLSAEQLSAISQENETYRDAQKPLADRIDALRGEMEQAVAAGDKSRLAALLLAQWEANVGIRKESVAHDERVTAILNPQQAEKLQLARTVLRLAGEDPQFLERSGFGEIHGSQERVRHSPQASDGNAGTVRHHR